jgi:hypothetical protein
VAQQRDRGAQQRQRVRGAHPERRRRFSVHRLEHAAVVADVDAEAGGAASGEAETEAAQDVA